MYDVIVIGGGAAGFFAALSTKENHPHDKVALLEKSAVVLSKVKISGGGRCNVTHACFDPIQLSKNYPRGEKELIGPFYQFNPTHTVEWFNSKGVKLKTEKDGRMFPVTDHSSTIIDCLMSETKNRDIDLLLRQKITSIKKENDLFEIQLKEGPFFFTKKIILATGSSPEGWEWAKNLGHSIKTPVPSLFTFNIENYALSELAGVSFESSSVKIEGFPNSYTGPLLITHFGFSGPVVLKLSAWGARYLHEKEYKANILIHWIPHLSLSEVTNKLMDLKRRCPNKTLYSENPFHFPRSFCKAIFNSAASALLNDLSDRSLRQIAEKLCADSYPMNGKTTHKEEFVTCGGIPLNEVNFKTMESKKVPGLFFAGEILDIDGITGGFNFQNAWTTGFIAGFS